MISKTEKKNKCLGSVAFLVLLMGITGYFVFRGAISIPVPSAAFFIEAIASGLFSSIPMIAVSTPKTFLMILIPSIIVSGCSSISILSEVR